MGYIYIYIYINEMNENFQNTLANLLVVDQLQLEHASLQRLGHIISNSDNMKLAKQSDTSLRYVVSCFTYLVAGRRRRVKRHFSPAPGLKIGDPIFIIQIILNLT